MSDDSTFLRAILERPKDNDLRRIYADWLEERGDPRSTFLRLEVAQHETSASTLDAGSSERLRQARHSLDTRWLALVERPRTGWRIVRTKPPPRTLGMAIPAFIHNGSYFLAPLNVFADGAINCWGFVDLPLFRQKLAEGWVVPRAEVGGTLSIHNLGQASVAAAKWHLTVDDIESRVMDALRDLNPTGVGLLDMQGTDTEIRDGVRYAKLGFGNAVPYRMALEGAEVVGDELPVFEVVADGYRLRQWFIYADGLSQLGYASELVPLDTVAKMFAEGKLTLAVPEGAWVTLDGLGSFQAGEGWWGIKPGERVREAASLLEELNGRPGAIQLCREAYQAFEADRTPSRREALRQAYAAVPEHLRRYCGNMDSKDGPIRRILGGG